MALLGPGVNKMDCKQTKRILDAYAAGELPEADANAVAVHLEGCADCAEQARQFESVRKALLAEGREGFAADPRFFRSLSRRIDGIDRQKRVISPQPVRWHLVAGVAAAAAAVLILSFSVLPIGFLAPQADPDRGDAASASNDPTSWPTAQMRTVVDDDRGVMYRPGTPYVSVSTPSQASYEGGRNPRAMPSPLPTFYFPGRTWPVPGTARSPAGSVDYADYVRLQERVDELEQRLESLENVTLVPGSD